MSEQSELTTERAVYPCFLIGGENHGQVYLLGDRPRALQTPGKAPFFYHQRADFHEAHFRVHTYLWSTARVQGYTTDWEYYRHDSLDEQAGMLRLWSLLWDVAQRFARAGGWDAENTCHRCGGTGTERRKP